MCVKEFITPEQRFYELRAKKSSQGLNDVENQEMELLSEIIDDLALMEVLRTSGY